MERDKPERGALQRRRKRSLGCYGSYDSGRHAQGRAAQRQAQRRWQSRSAGPGIRELRNLKRKPYLFGFISTRQHTPAYTSLHNRDGGTGLLGISAAPCCPRWIVPPLSGHFRQDTVRSTSSGSATTTASNANASITGVSKIRHRPVSTLATTLTIWIDFVRSWPASSDVSQSSYTKKRARAYPPPRRPCPGSPHHPKNGRPAIGGVLLSIGRKHHSAVKNKKVRRRPTAKQQRPRPIEPPPHGRRLTHEFS